MLFSKHDLEFMGPYRFHLRITPIYEKGGAPAWPRALVSKELLGNSTDFMPTDRYGDDWREYEQPGSGLIIRLHHGPQQSEALQAA